MKVASLVGLAVVLSCTGMVWADDYTWAGTGTAVGWTTTTAWNPNPTVDGEYADPLKSFGLSTLGDIASANGGTFGAQLTVNTGATLRLTASSTASNLVLNGGAISTANGGYTLTGTVNILGDSTIQNTYAGQTLTVKPVLSGTGTLNVYTTNNGGVSQIQFSSASAAGFSGPVSITGTGRTFIKANNALGTGTVTVQTGATLIMNRSADTNTGYTLNNSLVEVKAGGNLLVSGGNWPGSLSQTVSNLYLNGGTLDMYSSNSDWAGKFTGTITLGANASIKNSANGSQGPLTVNATLIGSDPFTVYAAALSPLNFAGAATGLTGSVTIDGPGMTVVQSNNALGSGTIAVNSGANLALEGVTMNNRIDVPAGGKLLLHGVGGVATAPNVYVNGGVIDIYGTWSLTLSGTINLGPNSSIKNTTNSQDCPLTVNATLIGSDPLTVYTAANSVIKFAGAGLTASVTIDGAGNTIAQSNNALGSGTITVQPGSHLVLDGVTMNNRIDVSAGGSLRVHGGNWPGSLLSTAPNVYLNGGALDMYKTDGSATFAGTIHVGPNSSIKNTAPNHEQALFMNAALIGSDALTVNTVTDGIVVFNADVAGFSGDVNLTGSGIVAAGKSEAFGPGTVTGTSSATLYLSGTQSNVIRVYTGGLYVNGAATVSDLTLANDTTPLSVTWNKYVGGSAGVASLAGTVHLGAAGLNINWPPAQYNDSAFDLKAPLSGSAPINGTVGYSSPYRSKITLSGDNSGFSGPISISGAAVGNCGLFVTNLNGLGTGPVTIGTNAGLFLQKAGGAVDWTLTNNLSGSGTIKVEAGAGANILTLQGDTITPGYTVTGTDGTPLLIKGQAAFALNGLSPATLVSNIAPTYTGTNPPVLSGGQNRKLTVTNTLTGLANATLQITTDMTLTDIANVYGLPMNKSWNVLTAGGDLVSAGEKFGHLQFPSEMGGPVTYVYDGGANQTNVWVRLAHMGDFNFDNKVNSDDLVQLSNNWRQGNKGWTDGDFTFDGTVNSDDLVALANNWQWGVSAGGGMAAGVPEPASLTLLALGALALIRRQKRQG